MRKGEYALVAIVALGLSLPGVAPAAVSNDQVLSQHVREADGTSGQNTNAGAGVKTGHIQNGAVTDAKIAGPISASKISSTGLNADTVDGRHASDLAAAGHDHDAVYRKKHAQTVVVAKAGGDFADPVAAVSSITDAGPAKPYLVKIMPGVYDLGGSPLVMKPYVDVEGSGENVTTITSVSPPELVANEPRIGVVAASHAELSRLGIAVQDGVALDVSEPYVAATSATFTSLAISVTSTSPVAHAKAVHVRATQTTFRDVTIKVTGVAFSAIGIYDTSGSPRFERVTIDNSASGRPGQVFGILSTGLSAPTLVGGRIGVAAAGAIGAVSYNARDLVLEGVSISSPNGVGLQCTDGGGAILRDVVITAGSYGVFHGDAGIQGAAYVKIDRSSVAGGVRSFYGSSPVSIALSRIAGPIDAALPGFVYRCFQNYDESYAPVTCP